MSCLAVFTNFSNIFPHVYEILIFLCVLRFFAASSICLICSAVGFWSLSKITVRIIVSVPRFCLALLLPDILWLKLEVVLLFVSVVL